MTTLYVDLITSASNALLKDIRRAHQQGGPTAQGWLVAEGPHLVREASRSGLAIACLVLAEGQSVPDGIEAHRVVEVSETLFRSIAGTETPQGLMALVEPPRREPLLDQATLVVALDGVQDPGNAGTIARSAEAFGAGGLIFLEGAANPMSPKTLRASAGSLFRIPFQRSAWDLDAFRGWTLFAGVNDPVAPAAWDCDFTGRCAIVIGNEGNGVRPALRRESQAVRIPAAGVESLNAGVAASLLLYEAARQRSHR